MAKEQPGRRGWRDALDPSNNLLLTGSTTGTNSPGFVTKMDSSGNVLWTRPSVLSSTGRGVTSDSLGNVYAAGGSAVKFDSAGNQLWSLPTSGAWGIATGPTGNVYVSGTNFLAEYDPSGNQIWSVAGPGGDVAADGSGNGYVIPGSFGPQLSKYDNLGNLLWTKAPTSNSIDWFGLTADPLGNAYVTGFGPSSFQNSQVDLYTAKYDPAGNLLWQTQIGGPSGINFVQGTLGDEIASHGNLIYVTGHTQTSLGRPNPVSNEDIVLIAYAPEPACVGLLLLAPMVMRRRLHRS